jgi:hypothetical protein
VVLLEADFVTGKVANCAKDPLLISVNVLTAEFAIFRGRAVRALPLIGLVLIQLQTMLMERSNANITTSQASSTAADKAPILIRIFI